MDADSQEAGRQCHMEVGTGHKQPLGRRELGILPFGVTADFEVDGIERADLRVDPKNLVRAELAPVNRIEFG